MCRMSAHCVVRKNGWPLTSDAPARAPRRRFSSLMRSFRIKDLQRLLSVSSHFIANLRPSYLDIWGDPECSGNGTSSRRMLANVALRFFPLNGVVPNNISYINIPNVHQSTALV